MSLSAEKLAEYVSIQINNNFPDQNNLESEELLTIFDGVLDRIENCFIKINNKYFSDGNSAILNHLHGDQYAMFLYILSNEMYNNNIDQAKCSKVFLLNKLLHGCDIYFEVSLPSIFLLVHPLGTVLGRGVYNDYFVSYQRCGVGSNHDIYPTFGTHVTLRPGSSVLGNCQIGDRCQIAADSLLIDRNLPCDSVYFGNPKTAIIKKQAALYPLWRT